MNISFRVKKYLKVMSLGSRSMNSFAPCSHGSRMLTPKLRSRPDPSWQARMIPPPAPVSTMNPSPADALGELLGLTVGGAGLLRACRPEGADLPDVAIGREHLESVPHLLEGGVDDLEIAGRGIVAHQADDRGQDLAEIALLLMVPERSCLGEDLGDEVLHLGCRGGGRLHAPMIAERDTPRPLASLG